MAMANASPMFLCPVCTQPREVRVTKKDKPYLICDPCGVQLFIRGPAGIAEFKRLLKQTNQESRLSRLREIEQRYRLTCPDCARQFWIEPELLKTSVFDGSIKGFRCPQKNCDTIIPWEQKQ